MSNPEKITGTGIRFDPAADPEAMAAARRVFDETIRQFPRVTVEPGQIGVNRISLVQRAPDVMIFSVDLRSKYADCSVSMGGPEGPHVYLWADERTLYCDRDAEPTCITLPAECANWHVTADCARYTLEIIAYNLGNPRGWATVWEAQKEEEEEEEKERES